MGVLINSSLVTSFFAGTAALFAPCCITVLLPTYLASIFRGKGWVYFMTFIYFLGILVVFLPLGLGFGSLGQLFTQFHDWIFNLGAIFLLLLGFSIFFRLHATLPIHINPALVSQNIPSIFLLGVFSGLASACCAPVLAGVLALSVLPGSLFWGGMYSLGYVLGMVSPLFLIALFLDRVNFTNKFLTFKKSVRILGREITLSGFLASLMFLAMGTLILFLSLTHRLGTDSGLQMTANILIAKYVNALKDLMAGIPQFLLPLLFLLMLLVIIGMALKRSQLR